MLAIIKTWGECYAASDLTNAQKIKVSEHNLKQIERIVHQEDLDPSILQKALLLH